MITALRLKCIGFRNHKVALRVIELKYFVLALVHKSLKLSALRINTLHCSHVSLCFVLSGSFYFN